MRLYKLFRRRGSEDGLSEEVERALGPSPAEFSGSSWHRAGKRLFHATRPKFFPASVLPVVAGSAWGYAVGGSLDVTIFVLALVATVLVHGAANVLNDVSDDIGGSDRANADRIYPYTGGSRFIQEEILTVHEMTRWGIVLLSAAALIGIVLSLLRGPVVLAFGLSGILLAVLYSFGPRPLSALGVGEAGVAVAFGLLPVAGAAWLQSQQLDLFTVVFSIPISMWVASILLINEVPDRVADAAVGKRTLPVRLGPGPTRAIYLVMHLIAFAAIAWLVVAGQLPLWALLSALLLLLALRAAAGIAGPSAGPLKLRQGIETTLGIHTLGSIGLTVFAVLSAF